ncbi:anti-sigma factor [Microbacterium sp. M1A1_1b]|uniref:anti-sigma factor n=1 Tax=Curtobacterium sp. VKM Ac-2922 TaxID=2929475 RepID=UPI001FB3B0AF|nr:anti-sigma factor [Curtobacterium sp. VKM Ac-2922]MCJ1714948.1 anti-sigma factor [Curtobacterium sp. VKM Ac-2922]
MNHIDEETLALLAIGEVGPSGAEAEHLAACPTCRDELDDLRRVVSVARSAEGVAMERPAPAVWDRIATDLGFDTHRTDTAWEEPAPVVPAPVEQEPTDAAPAATPAPPSDVAPRRRGRIRRRTVALLTAGVGIVALVAGIGVGAVLFRSDDPAATVVSRTALDPLPGWNGAAGSAELERDAQGRLMLVVDLDHKATEGQAPLREVWMMRSDLRGLVSVGFLDGDTGRFVVPSGVDPSRYPVVDVSAEADDGNPTHSGDSVVRGTLRT